MGGPWEKYATASAPATTGGGLEMVVPKRPAPQTPDEAEARRLANEKAKREAMEWAATHTPDGKPIPDATKDPKVTEGERAAAGFYRRAVNAHRQYGEGIEPRGVIGQALVGIAPQSVVDATMSPDRRAAENYADEFIRAKLRKESGAAIPTDEMAREYRVYFPVVGDGPDDLKRKAGLRQQAIEALRIQAGSEATNALEGLPEPGVKPDQAKQGGDPATGKTITYDPALGRDPGGPPPLEVNVVGGRKPNQEEIDRQVKANVSGTDRFGAGVRGAVDTLSFGLDDEAGAGVDSFIGAMQGKGSFSDLYGKNVAINRGTKEALSERNPWIYGTGQFVGGAALPVGAGARGAWQVGKVGAGMGAAYGFGSAEGNPFERAPNAMLGAVTGGLTGAALGYAGNRVAQAMTARAARQGNVPSLVDSATGRLNEPLEALKPGGRVAAAKRYGVDLPMGAATDRGGAIIEKGLDILPGSAGVMNDARRTVEGQVNNAVENVAGKYGQARTMYEGGTAGQQGAQSWVGRFEKVAGKAYDRVPVSDTAPAILNDTRNTLANLNSAYSSNPELAVILKSTKLDAFQQALLKKGLTWQDLKAFRSRIGYEIGEQRFSDSPTKDQLRALYGALSEDMRNTAAAQGPQALKAFERANALYRQGQERIDQALVKILGDDSKANPEKAAAAIQTIAKSGRGSGNLKQLEQIRASTIKDGSWNEIASALIRQGGQAAGKEGAAFNPNTFVNWYSGMTEDARSLLFGGSNAELRKALDGFVAVNQRLAGTNALRNTSNTAPSLMAGGTVATLGAAMINPLLAAKLVAGMAGNYGMAKLWTSPAFVRWATGYSRAVANGNQSAIAGRIRNLASVATRDPAVREPIEALIQRFANDNAPSRSVAGGQQSDSEQGKQR